MVRDQKNQTPEVLSGWKTIARYLGMGVRTVQRYERQMGLPIRRPAGKMRGSVLATKSELDAWVAASPIRESFQLARVSSASASLDMEEIKRSLAKMGVLRDQMVALRSELMDSMQSLRDSIQTLQGDMQLGRWGVPSHTSLDSNPPSRRVIGWMPMETKTKAS